MDQAEQTLSAMVIVAKRVAPHAVFNIVSSRGHRTVP
jgi:hypothetical protein